MAPCGSCDCAIPITNRRALNRAAAWRCPSPTAGRRGQVLLMTNSTADHPSAGGPVVLAAALELVLLDGGAPNTTVDGVR